MALVQTAVPAAEKVHTSPSLLSRLGAVVGPRGAQLLADRLRDLEAWVAADLAGFEAELAAFERGHSLVQRSALHLLDLDGKHVRPLCVLLAARAGSGFSDNARQFAIAVELVHSSTLLHDDVVDLGETRRGKPTARVVYGNAASIFAGDWLLVEALRRIRRTGAAGLGLLDRMLAVIEEMILAESVQLESRGRVNTALVDYFRVVEGKTASLFRWAMRAGATAGGLPEPACAALERYGHHLGVAFQAVDDLLDLDGDAAVTGKALFTDLREGKMTYPLIIALERSPALVPVVAECAALAPEEPLPPAVVERVLTALHATGAVGECRDLARQHAEQAAAALRDVPEGPGVAALVTVAETTAMRER
jgi:octaprenyl-diphosphate synthase